MSSFIYLPPVAPIRTGNCRLFVEALFSSSVSFTNDFPLTDVTYISKKDRYGPWPGGEGDILIYRYCSVVAWEGGVQSATECVCSPSIPFRLHRRTRGCHTGGRPAHVLCCTSCTRRPRDQNARHVRGERWVDPLRPQTRPREGEGFNVQQKPPYKSCTHDKVALHSRCWA